MHMMVVGVGRKWAETVEVAVVQLVRVHPLEHVGERLAHYLRRLFLTQPRHGIHVPKANFFVILKHWTTHSWSLLFTSLHTSSSGCSRNFSLRYVPEMVINFCCKYQIIANAIPLAPNMGIFIRKTSIPNSLYLATNNRSKSPLTSRKCHFTDTLSR